MALLSSVSPTSTTTATPPRYPPSATTPGSSIRLPPHYLLQRAEPSAHRGVRRRSLELRVSNRFWILECPHYTCAQEVHPTIRVRQRQNASNAKAPRPGVTPASPLPDRAALGPGPRQAIVCEGSPSPVAPPALTPSWRRAPHRGEGRSSPPSAAPCSSTPRATLHRPPCSPAALLSARTARLCGNTPGKSAGSS